MLTCQAKVPREHIGIGFVTSNRFTAYANMRLQRSNSTKNFFLCHCGGSVPKQPAPAPHRSTFRLHRNRQQLHRPAHEGTLGTRALSAAMTPRRFRSKARSNIRWARHSATTSYRRAPSFADTTSGTTARWRSDRPVI